MVKEVKAYTANNIADINNILIDVMSNHNNELFWWRGQSDSTWTLQPALFHKGFNLNESSMHVRFANYAKVRYKDAPPIIDYPSWLFLMQHYGLPTRLLDWTQSPLVALHFAVKNLIRHNVDGVIWGISPTRLNNNTVSIPAILNPSHKLVNPVIHAAWKVEKPQESKIDAIAISAQHIDVRQMIQSSEFTIHGKNTDLQNLASASEFLVKIIIPSSYKLGFKELLNAFHINDSYLFPDLEHLSKQLRTMKFSFNDNW